MDFPQFRKALRAGRGNFHAEEFLLYHKQISIRKQKKVLLTLRLRIACTNPTRCLHQPDALPAPTRRVACTNPTRKRGNKALAYASGWCSRALTDICKLSLNKP